MKKLLLLVAAVLCFSAASAQKGQMAAGVNLDLGFGYPGSYSNIGIGAKFQYSFTDHIRIEPAFTYYLKKDLISMWDLMANVHYVFPMANDKLNLYPLAGLGGTGGEVRRRRVLCVDHQFRRQSRRRRGIQGLEKDRRRSRDQIPDREQLRAPRPANRRDLSILTI